MRSREHWKTFSFLVSPRAATCLATMLLAVALSGCGDDGDDNPDAGAPGLSDVQDLFNQSCAGSTCHVGFQGQPAGMMDLRPASVCSSVINVAAAELPTERRIVPGDTEASYLLCKVSPDCDKLPTRAQLMPPGTNGLPAAERDLLARWIQAGTPGCTTDDQTPPRFDGVQEFEPLSQAVRLSWQAATDDVTAPANIEYLVYMATESGGQDFAAAATVETDPGDTQATVSGLEPGGQYFFVVRARDAAGNIDTNTNEIVGSPLAIIDNVAPSAPGALQATALGATLIELTWQASTDDVSDAADITYNIYMSEASGQQDFGSPTLSVTGQTQATMRGLRAGVTYFFVVRARDMAGNEEENTTEISEETDDDIFFPEDVEPILVARCTGSACHDGSNPEEGMNLTEGNAHASLVGVVANQCELVDNRQRVEPNDPDGSYLLDKLLGVDLCGPATQTQMPKGGEPLSQQEIEVIRQWIEEGATDGSPVR